MNSAQKDSHQNSKHINIVTDKNFKSQVLEKSFTTLVLVDFWAGWCNPCKTLMTILDKLAIEYAGTFHLAKIDTEKEKNLTQQFNIRNLPTVKLFKLGDEIDSFSGVLSETSIREYIDKYRFSHSDIRFQSALDALESDTPDAARPILEDILKKDDSHANSLILLARIELSQRNHQAVEDLLSQVPIQSSSDNLVQEIRLLNHFSKEIDGVKNIKKLKEEVKSSDDILLQYQLACYYALNKEYEKALERFISIMQKDRNFKNDGAKKNMLAIFDILGGSGPLVNIYRIKISRLLH